MGPLDQRANANRGQVGLVGGLGASAAQLPQLVQRPRPHDQGIAATETETKPPRAAAAFAEHERAERLQPASLLHHTWSGRSHLAPTPEGPFVPQLVGLHQRVSPRHKLLLQHGVLPAEVHQSFPQGVP